MVSTESALDWVLWAQFHFQVELICFKKIPIVHWKTIQLQSESAFVRVYESHFAGRSYDVRVKSKSILYFIYLFFCKRSCELIIANMINLVWRNLLLSHKAVPFGKGLSRRAKIIYCECDWGKFYSNPCQPMKVVSSIPVTQNTSTWVVWILIGVHFKS